MKKIICTTLNEFLSAQKMNEDNSLTIKLKGSKFIEVNKINNRKWELVAALVDEWEAEKIVLDFNPKHDVKKRADVGITWRGYGLSPYFSEQNQGGFSPSKNGIIISDKLVKWFMEYYKDYN
jgi:hypothetical protein